MGIGVGGIQLYRFCDKRHLGECWKRLGACFGCGSIEHRVKDYFRQVNQMQALVQNKLQNLRVGSIPQSGRGSNRNGNNG